MARSYLYSWLRVFMSCFRRRIRVSMIWRIRRVVFRRRTCSRGGCVFTPPSVPPFLPFSHDEGVDVCFEWIGGRGRGVVCDVADPSFVGVYRDRVRYRCRTVCRRKIHDRTPQIPHIRPVRPPVTSRRIPDDRANTRTTATLTRSELDSS